MSVLETLEQFVQRGDGWMDAPSPAILKVRLDGALGNLI